MKYIRTKDRIYISYIDNNTTLEEVNNAYKEDKAIAIADTIEELCDCFIVVGRKHYIWDKQHCIGLTYQQVKESYSSSCVIYGAIWTDKGLIFVAKMNQEGVLELL